MMLEIRNGMPDIGKKQLENMVKYITFDIYKYVVGNT